MGQVFGIEELDEIAIVLLKDDATQPTGVEGNHRLKFWTDLKVASHVYLSAYQNSTAHQTVVPTIINFGDVVLKRGVNILSLLHSYILREKITSLPLVDFSGKIL